MNMHCITPKTIKALTLWSLFIYFYCKLFIYRCRKFSLEVCYLEHIHWKHTVQSWDDTENWLNTTQETAVKINNQKSHGKKLNMYMIGSWNEVNLNGSYNPNRSVVIVQIEHIILWIEDVVCFLTKTKQRGQARGWTRTWGGDLGSMRVPNHCKQRGRQTSEQAELLPRHTTQQAESIERDISG